MTTDHKGIIHVEILGQQYPIKSQLDSTYVSDLASYVHQKMIAASDRSPATDSARVAVLAALNIADEYSVAVTDKRQTMERQSNEFWNLLRSSTLRSLA